LVLVFFFVLFFVAINYFSTSGTISETSAS